MSIPQWQQSLIDLVATNQTKVGIWSVGFDGVMRGTDYFMTVGAETIQHPLYDYMQGNAYLKQISKLKSILVMQDEVEDLVYMASLTRTTANNVMNIPELDVNYGTFDDYILGEPAAYREMVFRVDTYNDFSGSFSDAGLAIVATGLLASQASRFQNYQLPEGVDASASMSGSDRTNWVTYPAIDNGFPLFTQLKESLSLVGALRDDAAKSLGCVIHFHSTEEQYFATSIALPMLVGHRRWVIQYPVGYGYLLVGGYLVGEGEDFFYSHMGTLHQSNGNGVSGVHVKKRTATYNVAQTASNSFRPRHIKFTSLWPLSWNTMMIDRLHLKSFVVDSEVVANTEGREINSVAATAHVTRVDGSLLQDEYFYYLSDGYGVYEQNDEARMEVVRKSWANISQGVNFCIKNESCNGRSVKETRAYVEYGKKRAKACKDNNFLDLPYNEEYTWKQIDNKLSALTARSVWITDAANGEVITDSSGFSTVDTTRLVTITKVTNTSFSYIVNDKALSGVVNLTEADMDSFFDRVLPAKFDDKENILNGWLAANAMPTVEELNVQFSVAKYDSYSLNMGTRITGQAVSYEDMKSVTNVDGQIAYLASQVADYRNFNAALPRIIESLQGSSIYPKIVDEFKLS